MTIKLPEPNFIERDAEAITNEWIALYEQETGKTLQPAQIERILIDIGAYRENLLRIKIQETAKSNLLSYAPIEILEHLGELVGVKKLLADSAKTTLQFEMTETRFFDVSIPKDTEVESFDGKYIFKTDANCMIQAGTLTTTVSATCETTGCSANGYVAGTINSLITPLDYVESAVNTTTSDGGADDESVESLRERIRLAPESFSNAGSKGAYRFHTLSAHQTITDVAVLSPTAGIVEIYPLTATGNPTQTLIDIVQNYLDTDTIRPLTDCVQVKTPQMIDFNITANLTLYLDADLNAVQTLINEQLNAYKKELASKLGKDIVPSQIISILNSIYGVYKVELVSPALQVLDKHQWANLVNFTISIGGTADE